MKRFLIVLSMISIASCAQEGWLEVVIVSSDMTVPEMLDELEVSVVATEEPGTEPDEGSTCIAGSRTFGSDDLELPLNVVFISGQTEWACVAVRAVGRLNSDVVIRTEELYCPDLEVTQSVELPLARACHLSELEATCGTSDGDDGHHVCQLDSEGVASCALSPVGSLFDIPPELQQSCDGG